VNSFGLSQESYIYKVQENTASQEVYGIVSNYSGSPSLEFSIKNNSNCKPGIGWFRNVSPSSIQNKEWHHIVGTYNGETSSLYVDGELISEKMNLNGSLDICNGGEIIIGKSWNEEGNFSGLLDEIGIWNRPLKENEVKHLYSGIIINGNLSLQDNVKIGNQIWTKKNLDVDKFRNGDDIPQAKSQEDLSNADSLRLPVWYFPEFDPEYGFEFGKLYNWYAVADSRGLAPIGWHVPSRNEWYELIDVSKSYIVRDSSRSYYYGDSISSIDSIIYTPTGEAYLFQSKSGGWILGVESEGDEPIDPKSINGMDTIGFSAISGGSYWWSSSEVFKSADRAWGFDLSSYLSCDNSIESELGRNNNFITGYDQELSSSVLGKDYINSDGKLNQEKYKELYDSLLPTAGTPKGEGRFIRCIKD